MIKKNELPGSHCFPVLQPNEQLPLNLLHASLMQFTCTDVHNFLQRTERTLKVILFHVIVHKEKLKRKIYFKIKEVSRCNVIIISKKYN